MIELNSCILKLEAWIFTVRFCLLNELWQVIIDYLLFSMVEFVTKCDGRISALLGGSIFLSSRDIFCNPFFVLLVNGVTDKTQCYSNVHVSDDYDHKAHFLHFIREASARLSQLGSYKLQLINKDYLQGAIKSDLQFTAIEVINAILNLFNV